MKQHHKDIQAESKIVKEVYANRFKTKRNPKSGDELRESAIKKYKLLVEMLD